jgi:protein SCO1/2
MHRRTFLAIVGAACLASPALCLRPAQAHRDDAEPSPAFGRQIVHIPAPTFTLTDQDGQAFALQSWRGRAIAVTFGYTMCPDVCPLLAANLALIQQELSEAERARTGLLFITTDPERDTPAVLRAYGVKLGADFATWKFLTGDVAALRPVWRGFGVSVKQLGPAKVDHTTLTTLVDRQGLRRVNYYGTRWDPPTLLRDLRALAQGEVSRL